jgi:hypothetical protein
MSDTSPEIAELVRARYAAMSPAERLVIGARMFDSARALVLASFPRDISTAEMRRRLCERLYGELALEAWR